MKIGVIDYGVGNLGSILSAIELLGVDVAIVGTPEALTLQDAIILPGVGSFADCAIRLREGNWDAALLDHVLRPGKPFLGICVGMQLLAAAGFEGSDNGIAGLGAVPGVVRHLNEKGCDLRLPHVGWNSVHHEGSSPLFKSIPPGTDFYFTHSYALFADDPADVIGFTDYGIKFPVVVNRGLVFGVQFHPEKSSKAGLLLLRNFLDVARC